MTEDRENRKEPDRSDYRYLDGAPFDSWLWEITRRSPEYREAWRNHKTSFEERRSILKSHEIDAIESKAADPFGLLFFLLTLTKTLRQSVRFGRLKETRMS